MLKQFRPSKGQNVIYAMLVTDGRVYGELTQMAFSDSNGVPSIATTSVLILHTMTKS